jgi:hypothetical protein
MGTFSETVIVDYHLSFADQGKQPSVFVRLQQTNGSLPFPFSVRNTSCRFPLAEFRKHGDMDMET